MIRRNARRLLKLVNTLLQVCIYKVHFYFYFKTEKIRLDINLFKFQFSRIEAGSSEAQYNETDIAKFTLELASSFESMAKSLKLTFNIDVPSQQELQQHLTKKVFIDQDMYEKVLFNLCKYKNFTLVVIYLYIYFLKEYA